MLLLPTHRRAGKGCKLHEIVKRIIQVNMPRTSESTNFARSNGASGVAGIFNVDDPFRLMVEAVVDYAILMLTPEGFVSTWNLGAQRIKGYRAEEILGRHFSVFYPVEAISSGLPEHELAAATAHGRYENEGWRIRKDGSRFWASVVITPLRDRAGNLIGFGKVTRDLTERRRAAEETASAYAQLSSVLECTSDSVIKISREWTLLYGNRRAVESLPDFEVGKNYWACFPEVVSTPAEHNLRTAMEQHSETRYEYQDAAYDRWFRVHAFPSDDGLAVFFSDITAEKKMRDQLAMEQILREKRIEALSHMAGGLAHEISNPLAIIYAKASDLQRSAAGEASVPAHTVRAASDSIVQTCDRAIRILRGLRGFGREAGQDPMALASIEEIVDQCLELQQTRFERHKVELRLDIKSGVPDLLCRETQIGQIVTNLLNNAFDAIVQADCADRWISLTAERSEQDICIDVTDSGPGIEDHFKAHLMEPFFTTKEIALGMGVGLSLSRAIAQDHGGTLTLREGTRHTCFRLILPIDAARPQSKQDGSR